MELQNKSKAIIMKNLKESKAFQIAIVVIILAIAMVVESIVDFLLSKM
jgi:hypothetical protein